MTTIRNVVASFLEKIAEEETQQSIKNIKGPDAEAADEIGKLAKFNNELLGIVKGWLDEAIRMKGEPSEEKYLNKLMEMINKRLSNEVLSDTKEE